MYNKKLVIFDFDGVIVESLNFSFEVNKKTNPDLTWEQYLVMSHGNFYASYESENPSVVFSPNPNFREEYKAGIRNFDTHVDIQNAVRNLYTKYHTAIVSSGSEEVITHFLEKDGLNNFFGDILGAETHKSKVIKIKSLLEKYSVSQSDAVFITDTLGDIREAHEAGVKSIGVLWGLHDRETLELGKPEFIIRNPAELEETVEKILN